MAKYRHHLQWKGGGLGADTTLPSGLFGVKAVATGRYHSLALLATGRVVPWGNNNSGQCDVPPTLESIVAIDANAFQSIVLKSDSTVESFGTD